MKLIVGLGNPGPKYQKTRHNTGFRAVDVLAGSAVWKESKKFHSQLAETTVAGEKVLLAKPQTFMNRSGQAVKALAKFYKIPLPDILIIYDDIDLLAGQTRLRSAGSAGGHQGMAAVIRALGSENIARLKIGIAENKAGKQSVPAEEYVLQKFTKSGDIKIKKSLAQTPEMVADWIAFKKLLAVSDLRRRAPQP